MQLTPASLRPSQCRSDSLSLLLRRACRDFRVAAFIALRFTQALSFGAVRLTLRRLGKRPAFPVGEPTFS